MLQTIENVNAAVNNFVWGVPAMVCIIGVGLVLSARTGFIQFRKFGYAIKNSIGRIFTKSEAKEGSITPFQAVCTALAATVGTGNIAGVAGAIAIGGAGAVFWMWVSALLGMCTKFSEVTLAVHYREKNAEGDYVGGPMYYIKNGLGKKWYWMASVYAILGSLTVLGTGNATQVNTITTSIDSALISYNVIDDAQISMVNLVIGIVIAALVAIVLLGGGLRDSKELYAPLASTGIQLERLRYAAFLQKETHLPLLITGASPTGAIEAKIAAEELQNFFNVPTKWIEPKALTTKENALFTKQMLEKEAIHKIILVTNEWHMQRAKLLFQQQGFDVLPASVGEGITPDSYGLNMMHFIPQGGAITKNMQLLKEWIGYWKER